MTATPLSNTDSSADRICVSVLITGKVQGVGYRYSTREAAITRQLTGWVRNLANGRVEALIVGDRANVNSMVDWLHIGPPAAEVSAVTLEEQRLQIFQTFEIRR